MKKNKLYNLLFIVSILFILIGLSACDKNDSDVDDQSEKYLICKLNGKEHRFNYHVNANDKPAEETVHFVVISGWEEENTATSPGFGIDLVLPEGAEEKTYSVAGGSTPELDGQYYIQHAEGGKTWTTVYSGGRSTGTQFTLTITSLTDWGVKGTFSGKLRLSGGDEYITVTDGKFSAPYNGN